MLFGKKILNNATAILALMLLIALLVLAGVFPSEQETIGIFYSPVLWFFICLLALASFVIACFGYRRGFFFVVLHLSVALGVGGVLVGYFWGEREMIRVPYDRFRSDFSSQFPIVSAHATMNKEQKMVVDLPFKMRVKRFVVEKFPPKHYILYQAVQNGYGYNFEAIAKLSPFESVVDGSEETFMCLSCDKVENMPQALQQQKIVVAQRRGGDWYWHFEADLGYGFQVRVEEPGIKHYEAEIEIQGIEETKKLGVNHPIFHQGWILYLMDYDRQRGTWVALSARRDPGRYAVIASIWGIIIATASICFFSKEVYQEKKGE